MAINLFYSCYAQDHKINMSEKYDFELVERIRKKGLNNMIKVSGDTSIFISNMTEGGAFYNEYPPAPNMYFIQKLFYPNGNLKSKRAFVGDHCPIGVSLYLDKKGKITKVDEEKKWGEIKLDWILKFAEKEGFIDLETGKGRAEIEFLQSGKACVRNSIFELGFSPIGGYSQEYPVWSIVVKESPENKFYQTCYIIHGDTGEVLEKTQKQILREE